MESSLAPDFGNPAVSGLLSSVSKSKRDELLGLISVLFSVNLAISSVFIVDKSIICRGFLEIFVFVFFGRTVELDEDDSDSMPFGDFSSSIRRISEKLLLL